MKRKSKQEHKKFAAIANQTGERKNQGFSLAKSSNTFQLIPTEKEFLNKTANQNAVTRSTGDLTDLASMPGISSTLKGVLGGMAEKDKHGNASILEKGSNIVKSNGARGMAKVDSSVEEAKSKGSSVWSGIKSGGSKVWNKFKSFFGPKEAQKEKIEKAKHPDDPSTFDKVKNTGKKVGGTALIEGGAELLKSTVGKLGDIGVEGVKAVQSGIAAKEAHNLKNTRANAVKGKEGSERDIGTALSEGVRNEHLMQGLVSGEKVISGVGGLVKTGLTAGTDTLAEAGLDILKGAGKAAAKGAFEGFIGKDETALSDRKDLSLGESLAGQSQTETENLANLKEKIKGKGEFTEEEKIAAAKLRSALFKEGFDRNAGYNQKKKALQKGNLAQSMDSSTFSEKLSLEKESLQHDKTAAEKREGVNTGANTLSPSDFKSRSKDLAKVKRIGDDLNMSDASFTSALVENEELSHHRMATVSERIDTEKEKLKEKLK